MTERNGIDSDFEREFLADAAKVPPVGVEMPGPAVVAVIAHLQLALRHPGNRGGSSRLVEGLVGKLIDLVAVTPALRRGLLMGNDPRRDVSFAGGDGPAPPVRPLIVYVCADLRELTEVVAVCSRLTLAGQIVLRPDVAVVFNAADPVPADAAGVLAELALRKIDLADEVYVVNVGGRLSDGMRREVCYAIDQGKRLSWHDPRIPEDLYVR